MNKRFKFKQLEGAIRRKIEELKIGAGYAGEWGDRGASALREKLDCWLAGLNGKVPTSFEEYARDLERRDDPDWSTYQKLKEKFEG